MGKNYCKVEHKWCKHCQHQNCIFGEVKTPIKEVHTCPKIAPYQTVRLKDLLQEVKIYDVLKAIEKWYPDEVEKPKNMEGYIKVFFKLRDKIRANRTNWLINVELYKGYKYCGNEDNTDVLKDENGEALKFPYETLDVTCRRHFDKTRFTMSFVPWNEWLGMNIEQSALDSFTNEEIIAGCLFEMTWNGFDEDDPKKAEEELKNRYEEMINNMKK